MSNSVTSPDGTTWDVGVQRPKLRPRWRGSLRAGLDSFEAGGSAIELAEIPAIGIAFAVLGMAIIGLSIIGFVLLPVLVFVIELVVLAVIAVVLVPYRWLRGKHTVVARNKGQEVRWLVDDLGQARLAIDSIKASIEAGSTPQSPVGLRVDDAG